MTEKQLAKETSRTISEKTVLPVTLTLLMGLVVGIWALASEVADFNIRLQSLENAVVDRWTYHMEREAWAEFFRLNPNLNAPDLARIKALYWPVRK